ncbi:Ubiquitin carboxyl-terminal hydrolase 45 [Linnemannia zychae]|nr:Ubiquitin carboxyl-terminal hydrolase 45 [Linnemannia zychae]
MAGKKNKPRKKAKGPSKGGPGKEANDDMSAMDDAILAQVLAGSQEEADNAGIAALEESVLSEAIAASLQLSKDSNNTQEETTIAPAGEGEANTTPKHTEEETNDNLLMDLEDAQFVTGVEKCPHLKDAVKLPRIRKILTATHPAADLDHCHGCQAQHAQLSVIAQKMGVPLSRLTIMDPIDDLCYDCDDQVVTSKDKNPILQECQTLLGRALQAKQAKAREDLLARSKKSKGNKDSKVKIHAPGLQNLGNTCFFNSVMQVLVETKSLREVLSDSNSHSSKSIAATTRVGLGPLTTTFKDFLFTMWKQNGGTVTPRDLFTQIAKKWKIFRGFREQDSQELMRHLLEGIREEEADLIKKRVAEVDQPQTGEDFKAEETPTTAPPKYTPFIDTCFSGKLVSVIVCDACKKCSYAYEDYYDLSLPIKGTPVSTGSGSLMDRLKARSRAAGFELTRTSDSSDGQGILEADQGSEEHWRHVEKLLKNVPPQTSSEALSIERSLSQFTNVDLLDGEDKFACENCYKLVQSYKNQEDSTAEDKEVVAEEEKKEVEPVKKSGASDGKRQTSNAILRRAYKRYLVSSLPSTLVLHLKRFEHTTTSYGLMRKIEDHVDIPVELDMAPYCIPKSELYEDTESGAKELAAAEGFVDGGEKTSTKYRLYGATVHQGSLATGHYTNFVLSSKVELPPPPPTSTDSSKPSTSTSAVSNGVGVVLPDIPLSEMLALQSSKKKKKKGGGGGGVGGAAATGKKGAPANANAGANGVITPAVGSSNGVPDSSSPTSTPPPDTRQWVYCSDTQVRPATIDELLVSRPYILYYERC